MTANTTASTHHIDKQRAAEAHVTLRELMALEPVARRLRLAARRAPGSILSGRHGSRLRGRGLDFEELRRYLPGDDLRQLDWRTSMRLGKPFVRTYEQERDQPFLPVVDQRMNMHFGSVCTFKSVAAARIAALGAWVALQAGDRVGGMVIGEESLDGVRPLRSRERVQALFAAIAKRNGELAPERRANDGAAGQLNHALQSLAQHAVHDCLVLVISDFHGTDEQTLGVLRRLAAHNDVIPVLVYDPLALNLPTRGRLRISQGELQVELDMGHSHVREPLVNFFAGRLRQIAEMLQHSGMPLVSVDCSKDILHQLALQWGGAWQGGHRGR